MMKGWPGDCPTKYRIDQIRSNSNFAWNSYRCAFENSRPIITKFGTRHDSHTVVTCTKCRYDRPTINEIRGTRIFSKFWIRSNLSIRYLVGQAPGKNSGNKPKVTPLSLNLHLADITCLEILVLRMTRKLTRIMQYFAIKNDLWPVIGMSTYNCPYNLKHQWPIKMKKVMKSC